MQAVKLHWTKVLSGALGREMRKASIVISKNKSISPIVVYTIILIVELVTTIALTVLPTLIQETL